MLSSTFIPTILSFDKVVQGYANSRYSAQSVVLTAPQTIDFKHEANKSGLVNSVVIFKDNAKVTPESKFSEVKLQVKLTYNPLEGRTDIEAVLLRQLDEAKTIIDAEIASLLNKEV